ncbi:NAD-dependent epimerase/dehydratase family protein [Formosa algae]|uniref:Nucleoside-diphosphate-sugar epimerase n=1 Tax=Formosa algae TaxID=225843 RepID=A0A9X1CBN1_9FLAO|nr:NAD-dependent epimerase/dehydratase family protein [Formosa algae]MBP1839299.1 nucleoside-diphosphate-sugar epimerase [Formosa algae]MDQ0334076.1 nucleoside-diphosphate-sugar epimerase [Formosa algae]OEI79402.1 NAD-dependent epimerase [Formosa algae]PNW29429.1 NAD-dependent epimerase [Formosa algae]
MILVTGGTGLVGSHLLYKLASNNQKVRAIYRSEHKLDITRRVFSYYSQDTSLFESIEWIKADVLNIPDLEIAFKDITQVYHCAALVSFDPNDYIALKRTNTLGTANIVNLCLSFKVNKLCYVSSIATLGTSLTNAPITEETYWNPEEDNNVYAITKYGAEMEVWRGTQEGLHAVIINPGVILGSGTWNQGSGNLFKRVYDGLKYYTNGVTGFVAVEDVVTIMINLMDTDVKNESYIVISEHWSYKKLLQTIATHFGVHLPKKEVQPWQAKLGWRLDWLRHKLTRKPRLLSKQLAKTINTTSNYSTAKITTLLNYNWIPIETSIASICKQFKNDL